MKHPRIEMFRKSREDPAGESPGEVKDPLLAQATWELLWFVLRYPETIEIVSQYIDYEWIKFDQPAGRLLRRIVVEHTEGLLEDINEIENLINTIEERQILADIHSHDLEIEDPEKQTKVCLERLFRKNMEIRLRDLEQNIINADPDQQISLMQERKKMLHALKQPFILTA